MRIGALKRAWRPVRRDRRFTPVDKQRPNTFGSAARSHLASLIWLALITGLGANAAAMAFNDAFAGDANPVIDAVNVAPVAPIAESDVHLLAATAWAEARSEGEVGMRAVAHVVVNRVGSPRFGDSLEEVVLHPRQFSSWNANDPNRPLALHPEQYARSGANRTTWETAQEVAREVLQHRSVDPTNGALFYHAGSINPYWANSGVGKRVIGHHVFYADVTPRHTPAA
ncbi:MAG: cell wall hydrolase [Terricaulis silvestris]